MSKIHSLVYKTRQGNFSVGKLVENETNEPGMPSMAFRYDDSWLKNGFAIGHDLPLVDSVSYPLTDSQNPSSALFSFLRDLRPGAWITSVSRIAERQGFIKSDSPNLISLLRNFSNRPGFFSAFRFLDRADNTPIEDNWLTLDKRSLSDLGRAIESFDRSPERMSASEFELLWNHATQVGGNRPQFSVTLREAPRTPYILRFRNRKFDTNDVLWMEVGRELAQGAGLRVVAGRLIGNNAYLEQRFDRVDGEALCCLSASTLIRTKGSNSHALPCWLDLADILNTHGSTPKEDLEELFKRLVYDILTCNAREDFEHIWFYRHSGGWKLAPLCAPLPTAPVFRLRSLPIPIAKNDTTADPELAISVAPYFGLTIRQSKDIVFSEMHTIQNWKKLAQGLGASSREIEGMQNAFVVS